MDDLDQQLIDMKERIEEMMERNRVIEEQKRELRERKEKLYSTLIRSGVSNGLLILRHQQNIAHHEEANSPYGPYFQPQCKQRGVWQW